MRLCCVLLVGCCAGGAYAQSLCIESEQKLLASDQNEGALFGIHVAVDGATIVVGASDSGSSFVNAGAVYVYSDTGSGWSEVNILESLDLDASDFVGYSVSVDGDVIAAGAWGDDELASLAGAAYLFERDLGGAGNWGQRAKLMAPDGASNDLFGFDVCVDGDIAAVGAPLDNSIEFDQGSVYIYQQNGETGEWAFVKRLRAPDPIADAQFGIAVAIDNGTLVVGAFGDNEAGSFAGAVYVFERDLGGVDAWGLRTKILADTAGTNDQANDQFGFEVSIDQDRIIGGAVRRDLGGVFSGAAYIFERNAGGVDNWGQVVELIPSDAHSGQRYGNSVGIDGDRVVVGALESNTPNDDAGAAYVYALDEFGVWNEELAVINADDEAGELFGSSVAVSGDTVLIGARLDIEGLVDGGSATVITVSDVCVVECPADFTGEGDLNIFDVLAFLDAFNSSDQQADFTGDGSFNIFDVLAFLDAFNAGCP